MPFAWSKKMRQIAPSPPVVEIVQVIELPVVEYKISVEEHKNGEQVVSTRKEDDEDDEEQGVVQEGGRSEESDHGSEEDVEEARGS